ncbi:MAG: ABC transporter ATP-binding protein [Candidatus Eremiobacteraeota bacterium]|nr:ABC transporter ATP-binding protein [Candidatus Eremiobacteraeota bacterium]MBV8354437.1 ABC transporter ATP-binding protein [Candidatus Eremiobacteraeota bacterium]
MNAAAIAVQGLSKRYGDRTVVDQLSLSVEAGTVFGFLGPNGSGKSTTIKMLCGLVRPNGGSASVAGHDVSRDSDAVRRSIGYMAQGFALYRDLSVDENLEFYARAYALGKRSVARKRELIEIVGIGEYRNYRAAELSGGWQRRLALAAALIHDPPVAFLDEPTAGIDPVARRDLWDLLFQLTAGGKTFFVTTHYMDEAERCSSLAYIYDGKLLATGSPESICSLRVVTPEGTVRYAIATEDVMEVFRRVHDVPALRDATVFGRDIHVIVDASTQAAELAHDLGVAPERVSPIGASLEDAFVALTRAHAR